MRDRFADKAVMKQTKKRFVAKIFYLMIALHAFAAAHAAELCAPGSDKFTGPVGGDHCDPMATRAKPQIVRPTVGGDWICPIAG
jgi:hypothetical protein